MGRAERRRQEKIDRIYQSKGAVKVSRDDYLGIRHDASVEAAKFDTEILLTCFAQVLHDSFGFGYIRVERALSEVDTTFGKVLSGEIDFDDMKKKLADEVGINITT